MFYPMIVLFLRTTIVSLLFVISVSASAYYSNDPEGAIFVEKPFGDMSNCGPLSAMMLTAFAKASRLPSNTQEAIDQARMVVQKQDKKDIHYRWWRFLDIKQYFDYKQIRYSEIDTKAVRLAQRRSAKIVKAITDGHAVIINIDMNDLPKRPDVGKFYTTTRLFGRWGHFLVIIGYSKINGQLAYEIHDSHSEEGKNRFFYAKDINRAISRYNKKLLLVKKNQQPTTGIFENYFR